jgi:hypothetical protein
VAEKATGGIPAVQQETAAALGYVGLGSMLSKNAVASLILLLGGVFGLFLADVDEVNDGKRWPSASMGNDGFSLNHR